jgi:hypothetical protein
MSWFEYNKYRRVTHEDRQSNIALGSKEMRGINKHVIQECLKFMLIFMKIWK